MSINIDYFFNWPGTISELEAAFRGWIGCDLQPHEGDPEDLYCRFLGMEFSLGRQDYLENDAELNFEDYQYVAVIRTPAPDGDFRTLQLITMASLVYALYRRLGISNGILVYEVETLLARYEQRTAPDGETRLYDSVSGEFVYYPRHIAPLMAKIPLGDLRDDEVGPTVQYLRTLGYYVKSSGT